MRDATIRGALADIKGLHAARKISHPASIIIARKIVFMLPNPF
jgi:hypothetical protein